jgi:hypothetical protein
MLYNTSPLGSDTLVVGLQAFFNGFWRLARWNFALTKRIYGDQMSFIFAPELRVDIGTYLQARTCWMDDSSKNLLVVMPTTTPISTTPLLTWLFWTRGTIHVAISAI